MKRASLLVFAFAVASFSNGEVHGQCQQCNPPSSYPQSCAKGKQAPSFFKSFAAWYRSVYDLNSMWPNPYVAPARNSIHAVYESMVSNGWRRQNLLGRHHFDAETQQLTQSGRLKVEWILTQIPPQRRNVFVERGSKESLTARRIESIQQYVAQMSPSPGQTLVTETHLVAEGHSASAVDAMFTGYQTNKPAPVLPTPNNGTDDGS